jgi:PIN domain nuclease of toxin-antitoxin system
VNIASGAEKRTVWMILADTHVLVWLTDQDSRLPIDARERLLDEPFAVSAAIAFEYGDLQQRGRLGIAPPLDLLRRGLEFEILPFGEEAVALAARLDHVHCDPVDRMFIAHALSLDATLATADEKIRRYPVKTLW